MKSNAILICIIIPTYNRLRTLKLLIQDILCQETDANIHIVPIVVIDGSNDGTIEYCLQQGIDYVLGDGNWWYTGCINEGVKYAFDAYNPQYLLLTNDDVQFEKYFIDVLLTTYTKIDDSKTILTTVFKNSVDGSIVYRGTKSFNRFLLKSKRRKEFDSESDIGVSGVFPSFDLSGRCIFLQSKTWANLGPYDQNFVQYGSDTEFGIRALINGYKIRIISTLAIIESVGDTCANHLSKGVSLKTYYTSLFNKYTSNYFYNRIIMLRKHSHKTLLAINLFMHLLSIVYIYVKYAKKKK